MEEINENQSNNFVRICFPFDFEQKVKSTGKYDLKRLYEKGIVLSLNEITNCTEPSEQLLTSIRMELGCHPNTPYKVMIHDMEEFKQELELWFDYVKDKGNFGDNPVIKFLWLIKGLQAGSLMLSKQLNKEYDKREQIENSAKLGAWYIKRHVREFEPDKDGNKIYIHTTLFCAYEYLLQEPYYSDIEKADFKYLWDCLHGKQKQIKKNPRDPISNSLRHEVFKRDNYKCKECGRTNKESVLHVDHIIPVSQNGTDELSNLQTLCSECNLNKRDRAWNGGEVKL